LDSSRPGALLPAHAHAETVRFGKTPSPSRSLEWIHKENPMIPRNSKVGKALILGGMVLVLLASSVGWCKEPYKIGGVFSITGPNSFLGDPEKKSLEMAVEEINAKGGFWGGRWNSSSTT